MKEKERKPCTGYSRNRVFQRCIGQFTNSPTYKRMCSFAGNDLDKREEKKNQTRYWNTSKDSKTWQGTSRSEYSEVQMKEKEKKSCFGYSRNCVFLHEFSYIQTYVFVRRK